MNCLKVKLFYFPIFIVKKKFMIINWTEKNAKMLKKKKMGWFSGINRGEKNGTIFHWIFTREKSSHEKTIFMARSHILLKNINASFSAAWFPTIFLRFSEKLTFKCMQSRLAAGNRQILKVLLVIADERSLFAIYFLLFFVFIWLQENIRLHLQWNFLAIRRYVLPKWRRLHATLQFFRVNH